MKKKAPLYLGIDPSLTHIGFACLQNRELFPLSSKTIKSPRKSRGAVRLEWITHQVIEYIDYLMGFGQIELIVMEDYAYGGHNLAELGEAGGAIMAAIFSKVSVDIIRATPKQVKKFATGNSGATKEQIMQIYRADDDHKADAWVMAEIAQAISQGRQMRERGKAEVVHMLKKRAPNVRKPKKLTVDRVNLI